MSSVLKSLFIS